jgi:hypothetical protein
MTISRKDVNEAVFEFAIFLATSARGCIEEPQFYGSLRLLDALSRFVNMCKSLESYSPDPFLEEAKKRIDENTDLIMSDQGKFKEFTDDLVRDFAKELRRRTSG